MSQSEFLLIILAFVSELVGAASGVSSSTLFIPLANLIESFQITLVLTAMIHVVGNSTRTLMYWKSVDWQLVLKFGLLSILFSAIGANFSSMLSAQVYSILLGLFLIGIAIYLYFKQDQKLYFRASWVPYFGGSLSGLLTGLVGSGGAIRSAALLGFGLNPISFLATSTLIDFGGDLLRLVIYLNKGYLNREHYFYIPFLLLSTFVANLVARAILKRITPDRFRNLVVLFVFVMGIVSILAHLVR